MNDDSLEIWLQHPPGIDGSNFSPRSKIPIKKTRLGIATAAGSFGGLLFQAFSLTSRFKNILAFGEIQERINHHKRWEIVRLVQLD